MSEVKQYKCPCCNGAIEFDSNLQKMKCPYCDSEFEVEDLIHHDEQLNKQVEDITKQNPSGQSEENELEGYRVYLCQTCGGEIIGDESTAATSCPFCGNPVVMMGQFTGNLKPDYVIPFHYDKKAAIEALKNHYKGKILLPKAFISENHINEIKGVYIPVWLFNVNAKGDIEYKATDTSRWSDGDYEYVKTSYYKVCRSGDLSFQRIPVDACSKIDDTLMESIEPFDFSKAVDFQTAYLSGYFADKYDVEIEQCTSRINERIQHSLEDVFQSTIHGYDTVNVESSNVELVDSEVKYALYPVWLLTTSWNNERYTFAMNGQTGKFVGNLPMDKTKYFIWLISLTIIFTILSYIIYGYIMMS